MANSFIKYTGNGATTNYAVPFDYISQSHVSADVDGVDTSFTWVDAGNISFSSAPSNGAVIKIYRESSQDAALVDFETPSILSEEDLDTAFLQSFYMAQEAIDTLSDGIIVKDTDDNWDGLSVRLKNLADPEAAQDAVTKAYADDAYGNALEYSEAAEQSATDAETAQTAAEAAQTAAEAAAATLDEDAINSRIVVYSIVLGS